MNETTPTSPTPAPPPDAPDRLGFDDDGRTPNSRYPVLYYRGLEIARESPAEALEALFERNGWPPQWRGGVFDYHHYHSRAHEALGVASGTATLILGGEDGREIDIRAGDVLILPAGTGHCRRSASDDFQLVAAYPPDQQDWDLCRPGETDIATARATIQALVSPDSDPVGGPGGALTAYWRD